MAGERVDPMLEKAHAAAAALPPLPPELAQAAADALAAGLAAGRHGDPKAGEAA